MMRALGERLTDRRRPRRARLVALVAGAALLAACSGGGSPSANATAGAAGSLPAERATNPGPIGAGTSPAGTTPLGTTPSGTTPSGTTSADARDCSRVPGAVTATARAGSASDWDLISFDGTRLRVHWFPLSVPAASGSPTVLMGPGWGLPGDSNVASIGVLGALDIKTLQTAGFNVLTWDPRGFGESAGTATVDSADHEGRDVRQLIDWVATQPGVQLDAPGDPRMGMVGASYGGGIQFVTAAQDCRVDALVPVIAWHSLTSSLYKGEIAKTGWAGILGNISKTRPVDPHVSSATASGAATGTISPDDVAWFAGRGPADLVGRIAVPTFLIQGTVDTLFTLDEAVANYRVLRQAGVPAAMLWFCGGHGVCLTDAGDPQRVQQAAIAWLDRYVKQDTSVDTGPRIDVLDQNGARYTADDYPLPAGGPITGSGRGELSLTADGGSGPISMPNKPGDLLAGLVAPITPAKATHATDVAVDAGATPAVIVGAPTLKLRYHGTTPDGERPTRVFAQLVDDTTGIVLGNQVTPVPVVLDGATHDAEVPLEAVVFAAKSGSHLTLQLVATTVAYATPRLGGSVTFEQIDVSLPTAAGVTPR